MKKGKLACVFSFIAGGLIAGGAVQRMMKKYLSSSEKRVDKFRSYYEMLGQWVSLKNKGISIDKYFKDNNINSVAIYGMGNVGVHLYNELKNSNMKVDYCIDQGPKVLSDGDYDIRRLEDDLPQVDAIVVTACFDYEAIAEKIKQYVDYPVLSLDEILFSL